jgi:PRTRC genetic system protein A
MNSLVSHHHSNDADARPGVLYAYTTSGNGVFISAERKGLAVCFSIAGCEVRGLPPYEPHFKMDYPKISEEVMRALLHHAQVAAQDGLEILFHLVFDEADGLFRLHIPPQNQTAVSCRPLEEGEGSTLHNALIEIHSHHSMPARFSSVDDADEKGFRLYGVIGDVLGRPEIRFRVGLHGYFWPIPAAWVCELPDGVRDCNEPRPTRGKDEKASTATG